MGNDSSKLIRTRPSRRVRRKRLRRGSILAFAFFAVVVVGIMPMASACPYFDLTGDGAYVRLANANAVYSEYDVDKGWGYHDHHRWSYEWGWDLDGHVTQYWYSQKMKDIEALMDDQGNQALHALQNLNNDNNLCTVYPYVIDAAANNVPIFTGVWYMPCQVRDIAKQYKDSGDTSREGRVGEILALISFVIMNEYELTFGSPTPSWYWYTRHIYSPTPSGITYLQINPDFEIHWSANVHEVWQYDWLGQLFHFYRENFVNGDHDAMEVKSTMVSDWQVVVCRAEDQLMLLGAYNAYLATGVTMSDVGGQYVYFEVASLFAQFRFQSYC